MFPLILSFHRPAQLTLTSVRPCAYEQWANGITFSILIPIRILPVHIILQKKTRPSISNDDQDMKRSSCNITPECGQSCTGNSVVSRRSHVSITTHQAVRVCGSYFECDLTNYMVQIFSPGIFIDPLYIFWKLFSTLKGSPMAAGGSDTVTKLKIAHVCPIFSSVGTATWCKIRFNLPFCWNLVNTLAIRRQIPSLSLISEPVSAQWHIVSSTIFLCHVRLHGQN
ncbi:hypothetical protein EV361DRAFT_251093 [Lentinula raphanica]|nr:hypothetical protein EV361DRAFT_251093 [Lentinula raphanica]